MGHVKTRMTLAVAAPLTVPMPVEVLKAAVGLLCHLLWTVIWRLSDEGHGWSDLRGLASRVWFR